jgi:hypothetical protein
VPAWKHGITSAVTVSVIAGSSAAAGSTTGAAVGETAPLAGSGAVTLAGTVVASRGAKVIVSEQAPGAPCDGDGRRRARCQHVLIQVLQLLPAGHVADCVEDARAVARQHGVHGVDGAGVDRG